MKTLRLAVLALMLPLPAVADDFDFGLGGTSQPVFRDIAEDLSATINYKAVGPVDAGGITGFSAGAFVTYSETEHPESWRLANTGTKVEEIGQVGIVVSKGLPFDIDVGASYSQIPGTDATVTGVEVRYAIWAGSTVTPALAIRAAYSTLGGVDELDYKTTSVDLSISKGFMIAAPYAGIGRIRAVATPQGDISALREETIEENRIFGGVRLTLFPLLSLTPEFEKVGEHSSYNLRVGLSF